ncbi:MAG TPA: RnfH family protein [Burkholderiaceae bacterium]|nr:RnfH family protein [Burkholderiaceae bacterium]HMZ02895.1 RnfH family protein [Burkholderiaceae bacterium]HNB44557.1 RnfH family protein [Burkholderiaceae bacterium]HNG81722.1 RnfH family protein [Burkholderiaceae bacterium]
MADVDGADKGRAIRVEVVCSPGPRQIESVTVELSAAAATVAEALRRSGLLARFPALQADPGLVCALWGRAAGLDDALRDGDRVALCRSLTVDPKEARRLRYRAQGLRRQPPKRRVRPAAVPDDGSTEPTAGRA